jgi:hypothetical protein
LWKQRLHFRPDWEKVISPVVDYALSRAEVDPKRVAIQGISQGGYWVPRAVAFEKRIAAAIADPGVVDVSTPWTASLPKPMLELLKDGHKAEFDGYFSKLLDPAAKSTLSFRMRPFGFTSYRTVQGARPYCRLGRYKPKFPSLGIVLVLRPRCIGVGCRQRPPFVLQFFCSVSPLVKHSDSRARGRRRARARFLNFGV